MSNLKNGDLIMIRSNGEEVKAKFLKLNADGTKMQVFAKAKLSWIPVADHIGPAEPLDLSKPKGKKATESVVGKAEGSPKESKADKGAEKQSESGQDQASTDVPAKTEGGSEDAPNEKEIKLTAHQAKIIDHLASIGLDKEITPLDLSEGTGLLMPQIKKATEVLVKSDLILCQDKESGTVYSITQNGIDMTTKKKVTKTTNRAAVKKMKPAAKGDAELSKRDQVIALLKDKSLTVNDIAEKLDTDPNYVREIKTSINKKLEEPEAGTTKAKIFKLLKDGKTPKEVADKVGKSSVYVYKIQKQMVSSGHL